MRVLAHCPAPIALLRMAYAALLWDPTRAFKVWMES